MSQENNFVPEQENYKPLSPFQLFVKSNFPFIEATYESLDNYGLYCKVVEYLNNVIENENTVEDNVTSLYNAFVSLNAYVSDYFDNLDVQNEINEKLDNMVRTGELQHLLDLQYNDLKSEVNAQIDVIENQVTSLASGSPIAVTSTSQMTDHTKIYVNTTDGKWYYYDGDSWEIGGTYQSTGIANGSIDILKLDNQLKSNFFNFYGSYLDKGNAYTGYVTRTGVINTSDSSFSYYKINLTAGEIYTYSGRNISQLCGLVVMDNSDNVIYASQTETSTNYTDLIFKANSNNLTAYLSFQNNELTNMTSLNSHTSGLRKLTNIYNNLKYSNAIPVVETIENKYLAASTINTGTSNQSIDLGNLSGAKTKIYQLTNGHKYKFTGYNYSNICGLLIMGLNRYVYYASSTESAQPKTAFEYTYEAVSDGFIVLSTGDETSMPFTIELIETNIEINAETNKLTGLKLGADGDSIMHGNENNNISFANIIAQNNDMTLNKLAYGGGTIATGTYSGETPRHWICESVLNLDSDCDVIIVNGGINDYGNRVPLGQLSTDYVSNVDSTTFYGGLETLFRNLLSRFPTKKIAFVTNHNVNNINTQANAIGVTFKQYYEAIINTAHKYAIPVIDLTKNSQLNTAILSFRNNYTINGDGVHPSTTAYNLFYVPYVTSMLKNLL